VRTQRSYTCLPQCYFRDVPATYLDSNFVEMLCFKIVYAVLCGIHHLLFSLANDVPLLKFLLTLFSI